MNARKNRRNPPLPEHMAHDDLREIAHHLGPRLQDNLREGVDFVLHCLLHIEEAALDDPHADATDILDSCTEAINALNFALLSEVQRRNRKMRDEATRRSLGRRGPL